MKIIRWKMLAISRDDDKQCDRLIDYIQSHGIRERDVRLIIILKNNSINFLETDKFGFIFVSYIIFS